MMDENGGCKSGLSTVKIEPDDAANYDWRVHVTPKARREVVNSLLAKLMNRVSSSDCKTINRNAINRLTDIAMELEDKIFRSATTKDVYISGICNKVAQIDNHLKRTASSSNPGSSAPTELTNRVDWHDQAYQELQSVREKCLPDLESLHKTLSDRHQLAQKPEELKNFLAVIGRIIKFLKLKQSDIVHFSKKKLQLCLQETVQYHSNIPKKNTVSLQLLQPPDGQSLASQSQQKINAKPHFHPVNLNSANAPVGSSPLSATQQGFPSSQLTKINSRQPASKMGLEKRNVSSPLQQGSARSIHQTILGSSKQTNISHNSSLNALDSTMNSFQQSSTIIPFQPHKQKDLHQMTQPQNLKQQRHPQWIQQRKQQMLKQNPQLSVSSEMLLRHHSIDSEHPHQTQLPTDPPQFSSSSPQITQHSSPQVDQQNQLSPLSKGGMLLQSAISPFTPSSTPVDLGVSPLSNSENIGHPQTPIALTQLDAQTQIQTESIVMPGLSASPLLTEFSDSDGNQQASAPKQPLERLLKAVESISPKALSASVHEIGLVVNMVDMIAGTTADSESRGAVGEDLTSETRCLLQARNFSLQCGRAFANKMKRQISAMAHDAILSSPLEIHSFKEFTGQICDLHSTVTSRVKRRRIEPNSELLNEIKRINQRLIETTIDLDSTEDAAATEAGDGTLIRCSYSAVALGESFKFHYASIQTLPVLSLRLLIPADYPNSSPIILDGLTLDSSKESEDLSENAKSRFSKSLSNRSEPMSLGEMARTWDVSARTVFLEHAQHIGGECFSSKYGRWENCITT